MCCISVDGVRRALEDTHPLSVPDYQALVSALEQRFYDELSLRTFFYIPRERASFYDDPKAKWAAGLAAFPSAQFDVEEAAKSFALSRYTAAVFHLMRALESPLAAIATELDVAKHSPTWNAYLSVFKNAAEAKFPGHGSNKEMRDYYAGLEAQLRAVKDAWRNQTMHELASTYTEDEAHTILVLVRGFFDEQQRG